MISVFFIIFASLYSSAQLLNPVFFQQPNDLKLFAGSIGSAGNLDGTGSAARFSNPANITIDSLGNLYVADSGNSVIRKITSAGVVTTFAGSSGITGNADGTGAAARFSSPNGITIDSSDNLYVTDTSNNLIRKVTSSGVVTTFAGSGLAGSADGTGAAASFKYPDGIAIDSSSNLFVVDTFNKTIRKITPAQVVTTFAGLAGASGTTNGTGSAARFFFPQGIGIDSSNNLYVAESFPYTIRKITSAAVVTTFAGTAGSSGSADGTGAVARFNSPQSVTVDSSNNLYVSDSNNNTIRKITSAAAVTTFAGTAGSIGSLDGTGAAARFNNPTGIKVDSSGNVYVSDSTNNTIRKITSAGVVTTFTGYPGVGSIDGTGAAARFNGPIGIAADSSSNLFIADSFNNTIRKITAAGVVTTFAGTAGISGTTNATGSAARFANPSAIAIDGSNNLYVADTSNASIRKITSAGVVTTFAGTSGFSGSADGTGAAARFLFPYGIAIDSSSNLYVADTANNTIRKITTGAVVTTFAGNSISSGSADGTGATARFSSPYGVTVDSSNNIFVADCGNNTIRKITPGAVVTTFVGTAGTSGSADGTGASARFNCPQALAIDSSNNLYVADSGNNLIRKITSSGVVSTQVGVSTKAGVNTGFLPSTIYSPQGITILNGLIYFTSGNSVLYFKSP